MTIIIENLNWNKENGGYLSNNILFSIATKKDGKRYKATRWSGCRDYVNDALIANVNGRNKYNGANSIKYNIDFEKLRLLIDYRQKDKKAAIFAAKKMINAYEKIAGFQEKSVISSVADVQSSSSEPEAQTCLITGPGEWLKCSQLTSLITLVTRIFWRVSDNVPKDMSFEDIKEINEFWRKVVAGKFGTSCIDISSYASNYKRWGVLMENFAEVFNGLNSADLYPKDYVKTWHSSGGIVSLSNMQTQIKELDNRLRKLFEKNQLLKATER